MIYLDNAATTNMSPVALQALMEVSRSCYGNPSSVYGYGRKAKELIEESRRIIAKCIGALPEEVYFTSGGTESDNWAISQTATCGIKSVITSQIEHHAVLHSVERCGTMGISTYYIPVNDEGIINEDDLKRKLDGTRILASIMLQNNEIGSIQPIEDLSAIVHKYNGESIFHTDAVQAVGHMYINVQRLGADLLSASAHKFNGPKGVGFLYIRKGCGARPFILGGGQESGMRSGTENVAGVYAMAKALEENIDNLEVNKRHIKYLEERLLEDLSREGISYKINAESGQRAAGILNIAIKGIDGEGLLNILDMHDICISIGSACNAKSQKQSHVLKAIGLDNDRIDSSVRISIGRYNVDDDIEELVKCIKRYCDITTLARM